jgi:hypothetical protein
MGLTKPRAGQINFDATNITDPLIRINSGQSGANDKDAGWVVERGSDANVALIWDESADEFVLVNTTEDGTTSGNVTISSYADIQVGTINVSTLEIGGTAVTSTATELNYTDGVTSNIQTQLDAKGTGTVSSLSDLSITATATELNYTSGVTSAIQTQLDAKAPTAGPTFTGTDGIVIPSGTTVQRPVSPATGTIRFNTTDSRFEGYNGTAWVPIDTLYS